MIAPTRFRIAVVAPFPHPHLTLEGWMTRIAHIDAQLAGTPRIYLHFSEGHDDSQSAVVEHDAERAEALLAPGGEASTAFVSRLADTVDAFYVHTLHLAEHVLPWLDTGKVYVDIHGVTPEEEELLGRPHLRARYEAVEQAVLRDAACCIGVSRAMTAHYAAKYPSLSPRWLTVPVAPSFPAAGPRREPADDRRPVALYSGAVQAWQNLDSMLDLAGSAGDAVEFRFYSHEHAAIRRRVAQLGVTPPPLVHCCGREELPAVYGAADLGLILRDDSPVNRVACPTKLSEYLYFGLIPVVRSPQLGDFQALGYAYVTEQEFRDGFIPDAASRRWMAEQNRHVMRQIAERFEAAARDIRSRLAAASGSAGRGSASGERTATPPPAAEPQHMEAAPPAGEPPCVAAPPPEDSPPVADDFHDLREFRRSVLDRHVGLPCRILEIGAYTRPTVDPSDAALKVLDYYSTEELAAQARESGEDPKAVVPVDYVCRTDDYADLVDETFDVLIANHVLEHIDRPIQWLQTARRLLRDGGVLFFVLPDKKKSFDRFRTDTPLSHLLFEHLAPEHDVSSIHSLETELYYDKTYIGEANEPEARLDVELLKRAITPSHPGVHRHVFQAETFAGRILKPLLSMGLFDFDILDVTNCSQFGEFAVVLKAGRSGPPTDPGTVFAPAPDSFGTGTTPAPQAATTSPQAATTSPQPGTTLPRSEPAPKETGLAADRGKGLAWGTHSFRFDYDYTPRVRPYETTVAGRRIRKLTRATDTVRQTIRTVGEFRERFAKIEANTTDPRAPEWGQTWLPAFDGMLIYALLGSQAPPRYLEIGSGNSTKFARRAIEDLSLSTQIISVDPYPREEIDALCDRVVRKPVEDADLDEILELLGDDGVMFIDNSHRSFQNSDVTVCFTELVPALPAGTVYGVHDINLPFDYGSWFLEHFYNEQYLLAMYLLGGAGGDTILMPTWFAFHDDELRALVQEAMDVETIPADRRGGSSFWLKKR